MKNTTFASNFDLSALEGDATHTLPLEHCGVLAMMTGTLASDYQETETVKHDGQQRTRVCLFQVTTCSSMHDAHTT